MPLLFCSLLLSAVPKSHAEEFTLGIFAYRPKPVMLERYTALAEYLSAQLAPNSVRLEVLEQDELSEAIHLRRVDFVMTNPSHYLLLRSQNSLTGAIATLVSVESGQATDSLGGVIFTRADNPRIHQLSDLAGKQVAAAGKHFLGGYQTQALELEEAGIGRNSLEWVFLGSHDKVLLRVMSGESEVGFVRTGIIERMITEGRLFPDHIRVINQQNLSGFPYRVSTRLYPEWPFIALPHVEPTVLRKVASALMGLDSAHPAAVNARIAGFTPAKDYQVVEQLARTLRVAPYDHIPEFKATDVWARFRQPLVWAGVFGAAVVILVGALLQRQRRLAQVSRLLKESEEKYRNLVQYAPTGIYEFDMASLKFTSVNDVMCEYTGFSRIEFLEMDPYALVAEESRDTLNQMIQRVYREKPKALSAEYKLTGKNGKEFWVLSNSRFFYKDGAPKRAMAVVHDLTVIKRAEAEKRALEDKLQNARRLESLGTLAGGVAHDLNNILSGIVSYPDLLLLDLDGDSPMREPLRSIKQSGLKASAIVQDLLTLARRNVALKKVIDLNRLVGDFVATPEFRKITGYQPDITLETDLGDGLCHVYGSESHLSKTVMNLVSNAADAMPAGGTISIATRDCYLDRSYTGYEVIPQGEYVILEVSDTGIGMLHSDLVKIFEPFYTKKVLGHSGTGLGMSVVWGTVKDHDGYIDIATEEGTGTTFTLYFPASRSELPAVTPIRIDDYLGKGESILIVDDSPAQRDLIGRMMQRLGYTAETADSGEAAVAMVAGRNYDLLILDMIMPPGIDGLETYRQILEKVPRQKAIIASGYSKSDRVEAALRLGAGSYIKKPFILEKIGLAVRRELDRSFLPGSALV